MAGYPYDPVITVHDLQPIPQDESGLFDEMFWVRLPYFQTRTEEQLRYSGVRQSDNDLINSWINTDLIETQCSINTMFEHWKKGVTIRVMNVADTERIYRIISQHLNAWMDHLQTIVNIGNAPINDLLKLDEFAQVVYREAKPFFDEQLRRSFDEKDFLAIQRFTAQSILKRDYRKMSDTINHKRNGAVLVESTGRSVHGDQVQEKDREHPGHYRDLFMTFRKAENTP